MKALCLGINGTWRAGETDAGVAAGSVSEDRSLFFGATDKEEGGSQTGIGRRSWLGICVLVRAPAVPVPKVLPEAGEYASL